MFSLSFEPENITLNVSPHHSQMFAHYDATRVHMYSTVVTPESTWLR